MPTTAAVPQSKSDLWTPGPVLIPIRSYVGPNLFWFTLGTPSTTRRRLAVKNGEHGISQNGLGKRTSEIIFAALTNPRAPLAFLN